MIFWLESGATPEKYRGSPVRKSMVGQLFSGSNGIRTVQKLMDMLAGI